MKKIILLFLLPIISYGQGLPPLSGQSPSSAQEIFDINGVKTEKDTVNKKLILQ